MDASENGNFSAITAGQVRAARGILDWSMERLSADSGVPVRTLARLEAAQGHPRLATVAAIRMALEAAGVEFIAENGGGAGVRMRKPAAPITPTEAEEVR